MATQATVPIIEASGLTKYYGKARGIIDASLRVEHGEIFGFLGPNGAGKTTFIRTMLDFIRPSSGSVRVFGLDAQKDSVAIKKRLGNLPGELELYRNLTGRQVLEFSSNLRGGVPPEEIKRLAERLNADLSKPMKAYSHGNKQKICLIQAMMHRPELVVLDEPTTGLDPLVQQSLYELIEEVKRDGRTVFFSSHILPEVERLCDRVAVVRDGRIVTVETVTSLKQKAVRRLSITFEGPVPAAAFAQVPGVSEATATESTLNLIVRGSLDGVIKAAAQHTVVDVIAERPSLEEVFLAFYRAENNSHAQ